MRSVIKGCLVWFFGVSLVMANPTQTEKQTSQAQPVLTFETVVTGNQEQPKVIMIRRWLPFPEPATDIPTRQNRPPDRLFRAPAQQQ